MNSTQLSLASGMPIVCNGLMFAMVGHVITAHLAALESRLAAIEARIVALTTAISTY